MLCPEGNYDRKAPHQVKFENPAEEEKGLAIIREKGQPILTYDNGIIGIWERSVLLALRNANVQFMEVAAY